jgi:hypothetical protein
MLPMMPHPSAMRMRNPARWGISLLLLVISSTPSCRVAQPPQVESAGMRVNVTSARQKRGLIDCRIRVWNDHDHDMTFSSSSVRLMFGDERECSAKIGRRVSEAMVPARGNSDLRLIFEPGIGVRRGSNTVEVRDFQIDGVPSGETCLFSINI